ncbi:MAG: SMC family ATPase [Clostridia bacterium]|nr:SMC family ATPase [Clostridia bacterium]
MKPISIEFQCFGPYSTRQKVDFRVLARDGLFLIRGETGSGKTTVLDAICCALYGESSNGDSKAEGAGRGGLEDMRCRSAEPDQETWLEFIFEQDGVQYYFERHIRVNRRGNLSDPEASCGIGTRDAPVQVLARKPGAVTKEAEKLIGLRVDQFRQVILLPQGKFQKLLVSESEEKRQIISSLFNTGRLREASNLFRQEAIEEKRRLESERQQIIAALERWECESCAELAKKYDKQCADAEVLQAEEIRLKKQREKAQEDLNAAGQTEERFAALSKAEKQLNDHLTGRKEQEARAAILEEADRAAAAEDAHADLVRAEDDRQKTLLAVRKATEDLKQAQEAEQKAAAEQTLHAQGQEAQEARRRRQTLLESQRDAYARAEDLAREWEEQQQRWPEAEKWEKKACADLDQAKAARETGKAKAEKAQRDYEALGDRYILGIAGELGLKLRPGHACPVCGSTIHPAPAKLADDHVTKEKLEEQKNIRDEAVSQLEHLESRLDGLQKEYDNTKEKKDDLRRIIDERKAALDAARAQLTPEIPDTAALEAALGKLSTQITAWDRATDVLQKKLDQAKADRTAADAVLSRDKEEAARSEKAFMDAKSAWTSRRQAAGFSDDKTWQTAWRPSQERDRLRSAKAEYETRLEQLREARAQALQTVGDTPRPDIKALQTALKQADDRHTATLSQLIKIRQQADSMNTDLKQLQARAEKLKADEVQNQSDMSVADALVGLRSGRSLETYMLSAMLRSVTDEANRLLAEMYGGRFKLDLPQENSLDLIVYDNDFDVRGPVASLSGGEKFLVALALGIGLANVVATQAHSVNMDALFIDEGFGSLDPKACQDAVSILHSLRGSRMVGVISHVESLREDIASQLVAVKTAHGSRLEMQ